MNRSGIIRKIDNLGRVVIPKEIRKLLNLNIQDEMEVYVSENNEVVFRKVNVDFNINTFAYNVGKSIFDALNEITIVTSTDKIIATFGDTIENSELTNEAKSIIEKHNYTSYNGGNTISLVEDSPSYFAQIFMPIIKDDRSVGSVIIASKDKNFDLSHLRYLRLATSVVELLING